HAAARTADVPEQQLDDRRRADDLDTDGVLRPADGVHDRARPIASRVGAQCLRDGRELLRRAAARLGDELRRVARKVTLEDLEDAARMLQRLVLLGRLT